MGDVDTRSPINGNVWKMIVGLIKLAPRPLTMVVCGEYMEVEDVKDATDMIQEEEMTVRRACGRCEVTGQSVLPESPGNVNIGLETRHVVFYGTSLGVKMQHTSRGYVVIHSIRDEDEEEGGLRRRSGELKEGDVVLQVGGVWDLYHPISVNAWGILVKFIRECRRPMRMVVTDGQYLNTIMSPGNGSECCSEEEDSVQSSCQLSPCSIDDGIRLNRIDEELTGDDNEIPAASAEDESIAEDDKEL